MKVNLAEILRIKIRDYMNFHNETRLSFAEKTKVPLQILQRIIDGDQSVAHIMFANQILNIIAPEETTSVLTGSFSLVKQVIADDERSLTNQRRVDGSLENVLKSRLNYQVHSMASTTYGTTESEIYRVFGAAGIRAMTAMIEAGSLVESTDGRIVDPFYDSLQTDTSQLIRMVRYNLDIFEVLDDFSVIFNSVQGFNDVGLLKVRGLLIKTMSEFFEIEKNPENLGTEPIFASIVWGRIAPKLSHRSHGKISKKFDNETAEAISHLIHDLRKPLKDVLAFIDSYASENPSNQHLVQVKRSARRLDSMIESLRKIDSSSLVIRRIDTFHLDPIIVMCSGLSQEHRKNFYWRGEKEFQGYMDSEKIERLLQNLLLNAFEAAFGQVELKCKRNGSDVEFQIVDDGPGLLEEMKAKLFKQRFTFGKTDGTGIGLLNAQKIAEGHEGEIQYERTAGKTIFTAILREVFINADLQDVVPESSQPSQNPATRPVLFFRTIDKELHETLLTSIKLDLPEYDISEDYIDLPRSWVVCTDDITLALQASEAGAQRVWTPSSATIAHTEFLTALKNLALSELKKLTSEGEGDQI